MTYGFDRGKWLIAIEREQIDLSDGDKTTTKTLLGDRKKTNIKYDAVNGSDFCFLWQL